MRTIIDARPAEVVVPNDCVRPLLSLDGRGRFLFGLDLACGAGHEFEKERRCN